MARKPNYGIDAPAVIRNLFVACGVCLVLALGVRSLTIGHVHLDFYSGFLYSAASFALPGSLMLIYSLAGKFRHRDRMLAKVPWTGTETVLDVGAGAGTTPGRGRQTPHYRSLYWHRYLERGGPLRKRP